MESKASVGRAFMDARFEPNKGGRLRNSEERIRAVDAPRYQSLEYHALPKEIPKYILASRAQAAQL